MHIQSASAFDEASVQPIHDGPILLERVLRTDIAPLDGLTGGFRAAQVTLIDSDNAYASDLLHQLCVRAVDEFDEEVVWVDGGNAVDPYKLAAICKRLRLDRREVLSRVNISRAFTAYQFVSLIEERLEAEVDRSAAGTVILSSATDLFMDRDMRWMESYQLLRRCADVISRVTRDREAVTLMTSHTPGRACPDPRMTALLHGSADAVVQVRTRRDGMVFRLPREGRSLLFSPTPWNQATLNEFRGDMHGKDGADLPIGP